MKAVVLDYGVGNLYSIARAFQRAGADVVLEPDPARALDGDVLVLPGVGAYAPAAEWLAPRCKEIASALGDGHPCLAVCLGMQLLFEQSEEGPGSGLGVMTGDVARLTTQTVPHMGWNTLDADAEPLLRSCDLDTAYFANSYACRPADTGVVTAWTTHEGYRLPAVVRRARTLGVQFHPEKSAQPGLALIAGFLREVLA
jgi:glutamine amidotransferase